MKALIFLICLISINAFADYKYDYKTGNSYSTYTDSVGNTYVRGFNTKTGSTWNTTIENDGDMRGTDSGGNYWNYNRGSKTYMNYGTGKTCYGSGAYRTCY